MKNKKEVIESLKIGYSIVVIHFPRKVEARLTKVLESGEEEKISLGTFNALKNKNLIGLHSSSFGTFTRHYYKLKA